MKPLAFALLLATVLVLGACGGDDMSYEDARANVIKELDQGIVAAGFDPATPESVELQLTHCPGTVPELPEAEWALNLLWSTTVDDAAAVTRALEEAEIRLSDELGESRVSLRRPTARMLSLQFTNERVITSVMLLDSNVLEASSLGPCTQLPPGEADRLLDPDLDPAAELAAQRERLRDRPTTDS